MIWLDPVHAEAAFAAASAAVALIAAVRLVEILAGVDPAPDQGDDDDD